MLRVAKKRLKIREVMEIYTDEEAGKLIDHEDLTRRAIESVENNGIVFIDEIDKIAGGAERHGSGDVSREGVQRDLLPLIEGTSVKTKYGWVKTDHVLFICSGAFHLSKPSDLVPELQGRLPIRVELKALPKKTSSVSLPRPMLLLSSSTKHFWGPTAPSLLSHPRRSRRLLIMRLK